MTNATTPMDVGRLLWAIRDYATAVQHLSDDLQDKAWLTVMGEVNAITAQLASVTAERDVALKRVKGARKFMHDFTTQVLTMADKNQGPRGADLISEFLIGSRMPPEETRALHAAIQVAVEAKQPADIVDALLAQCETDECAVCGSICCPHGEPLHFHHDGCPACDCPQ